MTDKRMDARLRDAGERWRAAHDRAATATAVEDVPLQPATDDRRPSRSAATLASVAAVAAVALLAAVWLALRPGATPSAATTQLTGTDWVLVSYRHGTDSTARPPGGVRLRIAGGRIAGDDGCNSFSGPVEVRSRTLRLGDLATTAMACRHELPLSDYFQGTLTWSITGQTLTITKDGVGTLTYRRPQPGSPDDLVNRTWVLQGVEHPNTAATPGSAAFEPVTDSTLFISSGGSLTADIRCGEFTAAAQVSARELTVRDRRFTPHSCPPPAPGLPVGDTPVHGTLATVLAGTVPWRISGDVLKIGPREGPVLQYRRSAAEPGPSPTSTATVSGVGTAGPSLRSGTSLTGN